MKKMTLREQDGAEWVRINKKEALLFIQDGAEVMACPCKLNPLSPWGIGFDVTYIYKQQRKYYEDDIIKEVEENKKILTSILNEITYYNCNNENGYYLNYYLKVEG